MDSSLQALWSNIAALGLVKGIHVMESQESSACGSFLISYLVNIGLTTSASVVTVIINLVLKKVRE
jgi:hypothetical protein